MEGESLVCLRIFKTRCNDIKWMISFLLIVMEFQSFFMTLFLTRCVDSIRDGTFIFLNERAEIISSRSNK